MGATSILYVKNKNGEFEPVEEGNPVPTSIVGSLAKEPFSGSTTATHTFSQPMNGFSISNDGLSSLTFTIETDTYTVLAGEVLSLLFSPFTVVTVTTTVAYRAWGLL